MRAGLCRMRDVARGAFSLSSTYFSPIPTYPPTHLLTYSPTLGSVSEYQGRTDDLKQAFATVAGDHTTAPNTCTCSLRCGCPCRLSPPADVPVLESRTRVVSWHAHLPRSPATLTCHARSPATLAHLPLTAVAGVDSSAVEVTITAASVRITATIAVPGTTTATAMTTSLKAELATAELATAALGFTVESLASKVVRDPASRYRVARDVQGMIRT